MFQTDELKQRIFSGLPEMWQAAAQFFYSPKERAISASVPSNTKGVPDFHFALYYAPTGDYVIWDTLAVANEFQGHGFARRVIANVVAAFNEKMPLQVMEADTRLAGSYFWARAGLTSPYFSVNPKRLDYVLPRLSEDDRRALESALAAPAETRLRRVAMCDFPIHGCSTLQGRAITASYALLYSTNWYGRLSPDDAEGVEHLRRFTRLDDPALMRPRVAAPSAHP